VLKVRGAWWFLLAPPPPTATRNINAEDTAAVELRPCQRFGIAEGKSLRGLNCHCINKAGNIYFILLYICRVVILLMRLRRGATGNGLGTTAKYLRRTTSGTAGNDLGTTMKYPRQTTSGAAGSGLGATIKYLRRTTSGAVGYCRAQR
jgi:hypothetical protein